MTRRLLLSYLALAVLILLILEVPLAILAQRFEHQLATNQVQRDAGGLAAVAADNMELSHRAQLQSLVADYEGRTGGEVTVLSPGGPVLAASSHDADDDPEADWRRLVAKAWQGQSAADFTSDEGRSYAVASAPVFENGRIAAAVVLSLPGNVAEDRIHEIWTALGVFALGSMLVSALVGVVLARSLALPLGRLEHTVSRFGRGELASRANESEGPGEVRSLASRFNLMATQLDELIEAQQRFVADASHQLRSPLTALRLRLENLEATSDEPTVEALTVINREVQRLSRVVDGLLTLTRTGDAGSPPAQVFVGRVITERCEAWAALAAEKSVTIESTSHLPANFGRPLYQGDLDQILDNLLANALEATPASSRIRVELSHHGHGDAEIHVIDEGPGMGEEDRKRAFDRFWQGTAKPTGHSGLGLAIVRQLAGRNGLEVELRPHPPSGLDAVVVLR